MLLFEPPSLPGARLKVCCHKMSWPGRFAGSSDAAGIPGDDGEPTSCPRCNGKVSCPAGRLGAV